MKSARIIFQGKSKPNPNLAKLSQIQPSRAKSNQGKSLDFLGRIEPYQRLARTPLWRFFFLLLHSRPLRPNPPETPHGRRSGLAQNPPAPIESPIRPGNCLVDHACLVRRRKIGVSSSKEQYGTVSRICKEKSKKPRNGPEFLAIGDAIADRVCRGQRPRLQTAATERLTLFRAPISRAPARRPAIRSARPAGCPRPSV